MWLNSVSIEDFLLWFKKTESQWRPVFVQLVLDSLSKYGLGFWIGIKTISEQLLLEP